MKENAVLYRFIHIYLSMKENAVPTPIFIHIRSWKKMLSPPLVFIQIRAWKEMLSHHKYYPYSSMKENDGLLLISIFEHERKCCFCTGFRTVHEISIRHVVGKHPHSSLVRVMNSQSIILHPSFTLRKVKYIPIPAVYNLLYVYHKQRPSYCTVVW